ncbi:MAG: hypothetical protein PHQ34_05565 [Methanothrix sp.]|nr:hypothetical protein [Methanothrix sp.]
MGPNDWFEMHGFSKNPFSNPSAEAEEQDTDFNSKDFFLEPPYFSEIVDNPRKPISSIIFGTRGDGKSFSFNMTKKKLQEMKFAKILIVEYIKFSENERVLDDEFLKDITFEFHINQIINLCLGKFLEELAINPASIENLSPDMKDTLEWFVDQYQYDDLLDKIHNKQENDREHKFTELEKREVLKSSFAAGSYDYGARLINRAINFTRKKKFSIYRIVGKKNDLENLSYLDLLIKLRDLIRASEYDSIYILIDRLDDEGLASLSHTQRSEFIKPLITSTNYLELAFVATKMFVPIQIKMIIDTGIRTDRINIINLEWDEARLRELLERRLSAFSNKKFTSMRELIEIDYDYFMNNVLYYSANNPRNLFRIILGIISELCNNLPLQDKITEAAFKKGIRKFYNKRLEEDDSITYLNRLKNTFLDYNERNIYVIDQYM